MGEWIGTGGLFVVIGLHSALLFVAVYDNVRVIRKIGKVIQRV